LRSIIPFNHDWLYHAARVDFSAPDDGFVSVTLPHTNVMLPYHNFDDAEYQFVSTYRKRFALPEALNGRRLFLDFEGAMLAATVTLNGHTFDEHKGGYTPFSFDITDIIDPHGENLLTVHLDSTERTDIPPFGHMVDYLTFGGIYREVALRYVEPTHIVNVFTRAVDVLSDDPRVEVAFTVTNMGQTDYHGELGFTVLDANGQTVSESPSDMHIMLAPHTTETFTIRSSRLINPQLWDLDNPTLYTLNLWLDGVEQRADVRFGLREAAFKSDGFYLNGRRVQLFGLNRHQTYPYIGAAAPARLQRKDADILKFELGCNIARTSHYPQSHHFLDRCDEIGLLVFEEIPGWQHIGDEAWQALSLRDVRTMIERDRNHPSIIIWGVRINESWDNHDFYTATNSLARQLDPTRPTGGVRFFMGSEFLEDVYTYNDFSNSVLEPDHTPHLITEFNGHMFPTKSWDYDQRRVEHALRHARVQSLAHATGGVSGAIGWCAFDYNTHREFGSGDRICYHGVMDMFRLPKYAARFYESQLDPNTRVVLAVASNWQLGDYNEGIIEPIYVFSNCDEIEVFIGEASQGRFTPAAESYPYLPHPPFIVKGLDVRLAQPYAALRVVGYRDGQAVAEQRIASDGIPHALTLSADDAQIQADGIDMTRLVFRVTDKYGNPLPYATTPITLTIEGDAQLIGENPFALVGGQAALYLKAGQSAGRVTVRAHAPRLASVETHITLV